LAEARKVSASMPTPPSGGTEMKPPDTAHAGERSLGEDPLTLGAAIPQATAPLDDIQKQPELHSHWGINE